MNDTISLIADIQDDLVVFYGDYSALNDLSISDCYERFAQHLFKTF